MIVICQLAFFFFFFFLKGLVSIATIRPCLVLGGRWSNNLQRVILQRYHVCLVLTEKERPVQVHTYNITCVQRKFFIIFICLIDFSE
jgi:hypothetical protein